MRDYGVSVLEQYPIVVKNVRRVRGAVLCETDQGLFLLREAQIREKRLPFLMELYQHLDEVGMHKMDMPIANKEGAFVTCAEDDTKYVLKRWFWGKECDVCKENEILECVQALAELHKILRLERSEQEPRKENSLWEEYDRHNRELRKIYTFVRGRSVKGSFEREFLKGYEQMYAYAERAEEHLKHSRYQKLEQEAEDQGLVAHGEYNYHNVLLCSDGVAVTNFERAHYAVQLEDLYYFMRKILEKYQYEERIGTGMLAAYDAVIPLKEMEKEYLAIRLAYPEKFWKIANMYYHSNKAWIPEKNTEKLKKAIAQSTEKKRFLKNVFCFQA